MRSPSGLTIITLTMVVSIGVATARNTEPSSQITEILKWLIISYSFQALALTAGGRSAIELGTKVLPVVIAFWKSTKTPGKAKSEIIPSVAIPPETAEVKPSLPVAAPRRTPKPPYNRKKRGKGKGKNGRQNGRKNGRPH
jgi:hypothetical protein